MDQPQYRLLQPNDDYKEAVIEKSGITANFTLAEVEAMQERNKKAEKELEGNLMIRKAEIVNVEQHYPEVKDMEGVLMTAVYIYKEAKAYIADAEPKLAQVKAAIKDNDEMIERVMQELGFEPTNTSDNVNQNGTDSENKEG